MLPRSSSCPSLAARLWAAAFYLGLAPLAAWSGRSREDAFVRHHAGQALALLLVAAAAVVLGLLVSLGWAWVIVRHREVVEALPRGFDWAVSGMFLLCLGLPWLAGLLLALAGSARRLPLAGRLAGRPRIRRIAFLVNCGLWALAGLLIGLATHAAALCRTEGPAPVCVLYDDMEVAPRWLFQLGAYRMARAARERWGEGSVAVVPLDKANLGMALRHARVVVLLCHGQDGCIIKDNLVVHASPLPLPDSLASERSRPMRCRVCVDEGQDGQNDRYTDVLAVGEDLRLVYITACDGGKHADRWQEALRPAEVVAFDRLSAMLEHVWWLWFVAPERLPSLAALSPSATTR
jgi:uncharacterized membrane protein